MRGVITEREVRLQLLCLVVSIGLHAVLTVLLWQRPAPLPVGQELVTVTLVGRPTSQPAGAPSPVVGPHPKSRPPAPPRQTPAPRPTSPVTPASPSVAAPSAEASPVLPESSADEAAAETVPAGTAVATGPPGGGISSADADSSAGTAGGATGRGKAGRRDGEDGEETAGLIKATPRYESNPLPPYPRVARQNHWQGTVRLRARISAAGDIEKVSLERSSGHQVLDQAALQGVRHWRFIPATRNGVPVASEVSIPVAFRLTE